MDPPKISTYFRRWIFRSRRKAKTYDDSMRNTPVVVSVNKERSSSICYLKVPGTEDKMSTSDISVGESSKESLLSDWSRSEDEASSIDSKIGITARIRERLRRRDRLFLDLTAEKSNAYRQLIYLREVKARQTALPGKEYVSDDKLLQPNPRVFYLDNSVTGHVIFEANHSLEALWNLVWYSSGHLAVYMCLDTTTTSIRTYFQFSENTFYLLMLLLAMVVMRMNGYLWNWLGRSSYQLVKFDYHNRRKLGMMDATFMDLAHTEYSKVNDFVSILAYYFVCIGLTHFYSKIWVFFEATIYSFLGTMKESSRWRHHSEILGHTAESCETSAFMKENDHFMLRDPSRLFHQLVSKILCYYLENPEISGPSIVFHLAMLCISFAALGIFGLQLFEV